MMAPSGGLPVDRERGADARRAALALHAYLLEHYWRGDGLVGPDCGVRLNYRAGRFLKSYLRSLPWRDELYYLQAQGYWTLANWRLSDITRDGRADDIAAACARGMVTRQRPDGAWDYPNREWRGRVATAEGAWAGIGLVECFRRTGEKAFLAAALRWHRFLEDQIGYQLAGRGLAVNYFAGRTGAPVPNNSAFVLRLLAELADSTGSDRFLTRTPAQVAFLAQAQLATGELPYQFAHEGKNARFVHFQCPQYNAFQCLDLIRYHELTGDREVRPVVKGLLRFLCAAVSQDGQIPYACDAGTPKVSYHAAAVAAALHEGGRLGDGRSAEVSVRVLHQLLQLQQADGGFPHSRLDYGFLSDQRRYPRHLTMILLHLLSIGDKGTVADGSVTDW